MAKYHPLYDSVWNDEDLEGLPFEGKAFFVFLWSNPRVRSSGIYRVSDEQLAMDTGLSKRKVARYLEELTKRRRIVRDLHWIFVRGYLSRQPNTPRLLDSVRNDVRSCGSPAILTAFSERYPALDIRPSGDRLETIKRPSLDHVEKLPSQSSTVQSSTVQSSSSTERPEFNVWVGPPPPGKTPASHNKRGALIPPDVRAQMNSLLSELATKKQAPKANDEVPF